MNKVQVYRESWETNSQLERFGISKAELIQIVNTAVMARYSSVANDPVNAPGLLSYIFGTRALREVFLQKGWKKCRTNNIESVYNPSTGMKVIFQNTDSACEDDREPKAVSGKGPAAKEMIDLHNLFLFSELEDEAKKHANSSVWFLCVAVDEKKGVRAELSCPLTVTGSQFSGFVERIYIINEGDLNEFETGILDDESPDQNFEIEVVRK